MGGCEELDGDCCPNLEGVSLACCSQVAPAPAPAPPVPTPRPVPPQPAGSCSVGDAVICPNDANLTCAGNQCCNGDTCPSADVSFHGCPSPKTVDCTQAALTI